MRKRYKTKKTKKLIAQLKPYWKAYRKLSGEFHRKVYALEKQMSKEMGVKNMQFFMCDNEVVGIGNLNRTMDLVHGRDLEK